MLNEARLKLGGILTAFEIMDRYSLLVLSKVMPTIVAKLGSTDILDTGDNQHEYDENSSTIVSNGLNGEVYTLLELSDIEDLSNRYSHSKIIIIILRIV